MRPKAIPYVVLLGFLWGSTLVVSRFSVGQYDPRTYISLRLLIAASAHLVVYAISGWIIAERPWPRSRQLWGRASIFGIFGTAVSMTCIVSSLQYQSSGVTALLLTLGPVVTVVLAQFFLPDEPLNWQIGLGVVIAVCGASVLLLQGENGLAEFAEADWRGYAWALTGITSSAAASVYARRYLRSADSWDVASIRMFAAAAILSIITYFTVGYDLSNVMPPDTLPSSMPQ
jgi:drug/metabolite transporter (DMT)-like permease